MDNLVGRLQHPARRVEPQHDGFVTRRFSLAQAVGNDLAGQGVDDRVQVNHHHAVSTARDRTGRDEQERQQRRGAGQRHRPRLVQQLRHGYLECNGSLDPTLGDNSRRYRGQGALHLEW